MLEPKLSIIDGGISNKMKVEKNNKELYHEIVRHNFLKA
jgi:hypothetical protein